MDYPIDEILGTHQLIYDFYFSQADPNDTGIVSAIDAGIFLKQSKLTDPVLKQIWDLADPTGKGYLDRLSFYITLKLISLAQSSVDVGLDKLKMNTPAPKLGELSSNMFSLISSSDVWYIKASSRIAFDKTFETLSPINNKISGTRVKPFLLNSSLPIDTLGRIWQLSDIDEDGQLSRSEFLISMQLVAKAKEGVVIPDALPSSLLPFKIRHSSIPTINNAESKNWVVTFEEKTKSDIIFQSLDLDKDGFVTGGECKDTFMKTNLPQLILANIWNVCDTTNAGRLNSEQFALAMHFINKKLSTGLDPPIELSEAMIPPSFRAKQHTEESYISKELEDLQTQVNELQREKLFYEQRASEHDIQTRQKRTELSNLELEMDSLFKTLRERELNRSEEQKKLNDYEDRLNKYNTQLVELKRKYESEKKDIETLKFQISNMESAALNKENDLSKIKNDSQMMKTEKANLEMRVNARRTNFNELNQIFQSVEYENKKNHEKTDNLKAIQVNLNKLLKEYGYALSNSAQNSGELKRLEEETLKLKEKLKLDNEQQESASVHQRKASLSSTALNSSLFPSTTTSFPSSTFNDPPKAAVTDDPFTAFDPFKDNDPFKAAGGSNVFDNDFSNAFDPFKSNIDVDPFEANKKKSAPPPRPAPPRSQTPSLNSAQKQFEQSKRPMSAMDFSSNNKLDLFSDQSFDPFDPFANNDGGNKSNWAAFSS